MSGWGQVSRKKYKEIENNSKITIFHRYTFLIKRRFILPL